jgi:hypothetical protein
MLVKRRQRFGVSEDKVLARQTAQIWREVELALIEPLGQQRVEEFLVRALRDSGFELREKQDIDAGEKLFVQVDIERARSADGGGTAAGHDVVSSIQAETVRPPYRYA